LLLQLLWSQRWGTLLLLLLLLLLVLLLQLLLLLLLLLLHGTLHRWWQHGCLYSSCGSCISLHGCTERHCLLMLLDVGCLCGCH
jgi:hypothetical protein